MDIRPQLRHYFTVGISIVEKILLLLIALATLIAIGMEVQHVIKAKAVYLSDILLLFIYLEVLAMSRLYVELGRVPVRYPIYIAVIALARYLTLGMKEMDALSVFWIAMAMLVMVLATLGLRLGHVYLPYEESKKIDSTKQTP
ncbi:MULTISPECIES: phosphate-starvation-inducible PsiE family protein [Corallincola]|uniref:Protein PsiE n=3 Tax=Corallincola TaxID=1775176 RepID=A0A368NTB8_9GAMM|nr:MULTISPECIES: phosphate-starvation-inducible PsiE family protein [Corallincola]RCU52461.1 phosphate-starvation-inducible E [Corallincola holothuriorum]TAA48336.1 phosphate-starvation-inducible E [Corallincola spongiicola]TCI02364.1 phosphate-starvation-inducible E [Corallincola luteus]